jgi:putative flippase GtrA
MPSPRRPLLERALHLRSPDSGTIGQGFRYAVAGVTVAGWYLLATIVLADVIGVAFQLALVIGWATAVLLHFTLQRFFVWVHHSDFALGFGSQVGRYLLVAGTQYGVTVAATSELPRALNVPVTFVYLATVAVITSTNFVVFRGGVFHAEH